MKLTDIELQKLAELSKLDLSKEELDKFHSQLNSVLDMFEKLNNIDTSGVKFLSLPEENRMREDKVIPFEASLLKNATKVKNGYLKVKSVLGKAT